jgi:DNA (cytosine-5)-methyltransferase 1
MSAYYNEFDPFAAAWLRELIKAGHIAPGDVDERSIKDVKADDLRGYTQCHFFAGIGVWSHALRSAGWSDERPVWSGSCPCQPFSAAGKGGGFDDERHLWPDFFRLIAECRPDTVLGEQVASKDGLGWLDLVYADLEGADYAVGAVDTCAAGFGAPHIRQRLYWTGLAAAEAGRAPGGERGVGSGVADADDARLEGRREPGRERAGELLVGAGGLAGGLADAARGGRVERFTNNGAAGHELHEFGGCSAGGLADARGDGHERRGQLDQSTGRDGVAHGGDVDRPGPTNGLWRDADWLGCRDGKWRPVEPGTQPLVNGAAARVGRLRGYGNAIVAPQAQAFVEAVMSCS